MSNRPECHRIKLELAERYFDALQAVDLESVYSEDHHSGIFLPTPHQAYFSGGRRVLLVGQETRGWRSRVCEAKQGQTISWNGVLDSMEDTLSFNLKDRGGRNFGSFINRPLNDFVQKAQIRAMLQFGPTNSVLATKAGIRSNRRR